MAVDKVKNMVTESGTVISVQGSQAWVQTLRQSACQSCSVRQGCGQKALASLTSGQARQVRVSNTLGAKPGDVVTIAIPESALLKGSLLVYALPLLLMVIATMLADILAPGQDLAAIVAALVGLGAGLGGTRWVSGRGDKHWHPMMGELVSPAVNEN